ncbi:MMPL family transporter [Lamprobacter modestohalophilus]|uniref:efflux RND transporter permease subunit n=1 Tax=Lamprobacter modestohalophilus TaxID=1064514 RepID=UPI002ADEACE4|nr:MMPL family transporter [Lamprobacter modestohalophilus]MEA1050935.1 MMPL family transporter [Lamprobacter modestohalophilus]
MSPTRIPGRVALAILIILALAANAALLRIRLDNAPEAYFPAKSPTVQFENALREQFPLDQVLIALFEAPDGDDALWRDAFLDPYFALVEALQRDPMVERVLSVATQDHLRGTADGFAVEPLLDRDQAMALPKPQERRARVLGDRFAAGLLVNQDATALALVVRPRELNNSLERLTLEDSLRAAISAQGLDRYLTALAGQVALDVAQLRAMIHDTLVMIPATLSFGLVIIWLMFRRWLAVAVSALVIATVVNVTVAALILAGKPYTLISAILPPLMSALTVASLIHWLNALALAARRGLAGAERVSWAYRQVAKPTLFVALTTSVGLLSLSFSSIQPIAAFGQVAAFGMLVQAAIMILLVPPLFARWDSGDWQASRRGGLALIDRGVRALRGLGMRRPLWVLGIATLLLAAGLPQIARVQTETDLLRFFPPEHPITQSTERVRERLVGVTSLELVLEADARDAFTDPARLRLLHDLQRWLEAQPEVDRALSMTDLVEDMHWGFHAEDPAYRVLPDSQPLIAQYLLVYDGTDLYELVNRDLDRARLTLNLNIRGARAINAFIDRVEQELATRDLLGLQVRIAGFGRLFADQEALLIDGQVKGLAAAVGLISLLMLILWRSPTQMIISMIPNLAPIALIFITMGLFGIWLDMATAMIASVTVGIAVDDTIHLMHTYRARLAAGSSQRWALARAYRQTGRAIAITTLILGGQFLLIGASAFNPTVAFGLLTAVGLVAALMFDLLVLPALLVLRCRRH